MKAMTRRQWDRVHKRLSAHLRQVPDSHPIFMAGYREGIKSAVSHVAMFDRQVSHRYRLSDIVLMKFNLIGRRLPRKNSGFVEGPRMVCTHHGYQGVRKVYYTRPAEALSIELACGCKYRWLTRSLRWEQMQKGDPWKHLRRKKHGKR